MRPEWVFYMQRPRSDVGSYIQREMVGLEVPSARA